METDRKFQNYVRKRKKLIETEVCMPSQEGFDRKWVTKQEKEFLDGLGSYSSAGRKHSRAELLRGYLRGLKKRVVWLQKLPGGYVLNLNPAEIKEYAVKLLRQEEGGGL